MATPPNNAKTVIRPYRRFLNSALHTRLQNASLLALLLNWDTAFWVGSHDSRKSLSATLQTKILMRQQCFGHGSRWAQQASELCYSSSPA